MILGHIGARPVGVERRIDQFNEELLTESTVGVRVSHTVEMPIPELVLERMSANWIIIRVWDYPDEFPPFLMRSRIARMGLKEQISRRESGKCISEQVIGLNDVRTDASGST